MNKLIQLRSNDLSKKGKKNLISPANKLTNTRMNLVERILVPGIYTRVAGMRVKCTLDIRRARESLCIYKHGSRSIVQHTSVPKSCLSRMTARVLSPCTILFVRTQIQARVLCAHTRHDTEGKLAVHLSSRRRKMNKPRRLGDEDIAIERSSSSCRQSRARQRDSLRRVK